MPICKHCKASFNSSHVCAAVNREIFETDIEDLLISAAIAAATDSAILGAVLGGSILGGVVGDVFDGDLMD